MHKCKLFTALLSNFTLRTYVNVKAVVTIGVSMDLHAMGGGYYSRGLLLYVMLYFREATIRGGLLNKGGVYSSKYGILVKCL